MNAVTGTIRRGFTLVELIVVTVILVVLASAIVPRFAGKIDRETEQAAKSLRDMLSTLATRQQLGGLPVELEYDGKTIRLLSLRVDGTFTDFDARRTWQEDPLSSPLTLDGQELVAVGVGPQALDAHSFRVDFRPGEMRPAVFVMLASKEAETAWRIELEPGSTAAQLRETTRSDIGPVLVRGATDLDAAGMSEVAW